MRYNLSAEVTVSAYTVVEAKTLKEAIEIAEDRIIEFIDRYNSADERTKWCVWILDGEPQNIQQEP